MLFVFQIVVSRLPLQHAQTIARQSLDVSIARIDSKLISQDPHIHLRKLRLGVSLSLSHQIKTHFFPNPFDRPSKVIALPINRKLPLLPNRTSPILIQSRFIFQAEQVISTANHVRMIINQKVNIFLENFQLIWIIGIDRRFKNRFFHLQLCLQQLRVLKVLSQIDEQVSINIRN